MEELPTLRVLTLFQEKLPTLRVTLFMEKLPTPRVKNSADNRAPPKQSLLTSFITFLSITFYTLTAFLYVRPSNMLFSFFHFNYNA